MDFLALILTILSPFVPRAAKRRPPFVLSVA